MKTIPEILAPLAPFLINENLDDICITPPSKPGPSGDDAYDLARCGRPKAPRPMPSPALV